MKLTKLKKLSSGRYELIIDNQKYLVYDEVLIKLNLLKPCDISNNTLQDIISLNGYYDGKKIALRYITAKMRTEKEIKEKLFKSGISQNNISQIINELKNDGYLDDSAYIKAYIHDETLLTLKGPNRILNDLKKEGFNANIVENELSAINDSIFEEKVLKVIKKRVKTGNLSKRRLIMKLKEDLIVLGYPSSYQKYLDNIEYDESGAYEKEYQKIKKRLSSKYTGDNLENMIVSKLYNLGYEIKKID